MNNSNNFNSQYNSNNNNSNNAPMQPVKNRFFNQNLLEGNDFYDVGTSTSSQVNAFGVQNNSSMVSGSSLQNVFLNPNDNANMNQQNNDDKSSNNQFTSIFNQSLVEDVNATVYQAEPEVLEDDFFNNDGSNNINNSNNETLFGYTENEVLDSVGNETNPSLDVLETNDIYSNRVGVEAPILNQSANGVENQNQNLLSQDLLSQQPLSINSLGATSLEQQKIPDYVENSKFFSPPDLIIQKEKEQMMQNQQFNESVVMPSLVDENVVVIDETALVKAYVGKNYDKYLRSNFSAFAMVFGSFAFFCRSMYFTGLFFFIFQLSILYFFRELLYIVIAVYIVLAMIMALIINPLYLFYVRKKVRSIKKKHPKVSQGDLNNICSKKGKNNLLMALLLQIVLVALVLFAVIKLVGFDYFKDIYNDIVRIFEKTKENVEFNGELKFNDLNIEDYFSINIPDDYRKEDDTLVSYTYVTEGVGDNNACSFKFGGIDGYNNSKELLSKIADYYKLGEEIDSVKHNDLDWNLLYVTSDVGKTYYRATDIDNNVVLFVFVSGSDTPDGICDNQIVLLLDNIKKK